MAFGDKFERHPALTPEQAALLDCYQRVRAVSMAVNTELVQRLAKDVLDEGGKKLGILQNGVFVFDTEDESSVLMDYCIYEVRRDGRNAVEQFLLDRPPALDSEEMVVLQAMQRAIYGVLAIDEVIPGLGVNVRDLLFNRKMFVADVGMSMSLSFGVVFASRLLPYEGFCTTTGAALPLGSMPPDQQRTLGKRLAKQLTRNGRSRLDPAALIRDCLARGVSSHVAYR